MLYFETQHEKFYLNSHRQTRPAQTDGGVGKAEQGSEQCDGCVQTFPMLTFNNKFQRETTPPKDGLPDPEADCGHDARLSKFFVVVCFLRKTLHVNLTILFYSYHLLDKARFCDLTFFNHKYGHKFNEKYFYLIFAGAPLMSE